MFTLGTRPLMVPQKSKAPVHLYGQYMKIILKADVSSDSGNCIFLDCLQFSCV